MSARREGATQARRHATLERRHASARSRTRRCSSGAREGGARRAAHALSDEDGGAAAGALDGAARARLGERRRRWPKSPQVLELTPAYVKGVVTFYTMYHQHPVGKHFIQVCTTSPCNVVRRRGGGRGVPRAHRLRELGADVARRQVHRDRSRVPRRVRVRDADHGQRGLHRVGHAGERCPQILARSRVTWDIRTQPHARETPVLSKYFGEPRRARSTAGRSAAATRRSRRRSA